MLAHALQVRLCVAYQQSFQNSFAKSFIGIRQLFIQTVSSILAVVVLLSLPFFLEFRIKILKINRFTFSLFEECQAGISDLKFVRLRICSKTVVK